MTPEILDALLKQQPFATVLLVIAVITLWRENRRKQDLMEQVLRSMKEHLDVSRNTSPRTDRTSDGSPS